MGGYAAQEREIFRLLRRPRDGAYGEIAASPASSTRGWSSLARAELGLADDRPYSAAESYFDCLREDPESPLARSRVLQLIQVSHAQPSELRPDELLELVAANPDLTLPRVNAALVLSWAGEFRQADSLLETALNIEPDNILAWGARIPVLFELGRVDDADAAIGSYLRLGKRNFRPYMLAAKNCWTRGYGRKSFTIARDGARHVNTARARLFPWVVPLLTRKIRNLVSFASGFLLLLLALTVAQGPRDVFGYSMVVGVALVFAWTHVARYVFNDRRLLAELRQLEAMKNSLNADAEDPHLQRGTQGRV